MREALRVSLTLAAAATIAACGGGNGSTPQAPTSQAGTHAISGRITGAPPASVTLSRSGSSVATTSTDATGVYRFAGLADGTYTVTPLLVGYAFSPDHLTLAVNGADVSGQDFTAQLNPSADEAIAASAVIFMDWPQ